MAVEASVAENLGLQMCRDTAETMICRLLPDLPTTTTSRAQHLQYRSSGGATVGLDVEDLGAQNFHLGKKLDSLIRT